MSVADSVEVEANACGSLCIVLDTLVSFETDVVVSVSCATKDVVSVKTLKVVEETTVGVWL